MASITAYSILRIHARINQNSVNQPETALLEEVLEFNAESDAMNSVIKKLREPVYRDDSFFGRLQLNRKINQFEIRAPWLGTEIELLVSATELEEFEQAITVSKALWQAARKWDKRLREYAAVQLLDLKNEEWRDEDEKPVSRRQFKKRMRLNTVSAYPDGSFEFWFDDDDLFWGHAIKIDGNLDDGPEHANIAG